MMSREEKQRAVAEVKLARLTRLANAMAQGTICSYVLTHTEFMVLESYAYAYQKGRGWIMPVWITEIAPGFIGVTPERGRGPLSQIKVPICDAGSIVTTELK